MEHDSVLIEGIEKIKENSLLTIEKIIELLEIPINLRSSS